MIRIIQLTAMFVMLCFMVVIEVRSADNEVIFLGYSKGNIMEISGLKVSSIFHLRNSAFAGNKSVAEKKGYYSTWLNEEYSDMLEGAKKYARDYCRKEGAKVAGLSYISADVTGVPEGIAMLFTCDVMCAK